MPRLNEIDSRVLESLTGRDKLEALLTDRGYPTVRSIAEATGEFPDDVSRCMGGQRTRRRPTLDRIRTKLADLAGLTREQVDELLGGPLMDEAV